MPAERQELSVSQFAELLGVDPQRLIDVKRRGGSQGSTMVLILEPEEIDGTDGRSTSATANG